MVRVGQLLSKALEVGLLALHDAAAALRQLRLHILNYFLSVRLLLFVARLLVQQPLDL